MRVLAVIETLGSGGAERALLGLLKALRARGHSCEVAVLSPPHLLAAEFEAEGIVVHPLQLSHRWNLPQGIHRLTQLVRERRPDVIHSHLFFASLYAALTRSFDRRPARIVTFHDLGYDSYPARTTWLKLRKTMDALVMRHGMDMTLAVSSSVAEHYARHLGIPRPHVVPNGLDVAALSEHPKYPLAHIRRMYGVAADETLLLLPGTFKKEKGHFVLLEALDRLRSSGKQLPRLLLAGTGPLLPAVRQQVVRYALEDHVVFAGLLAHSDLLDLISSADLIVMPSTHEGAGVTAAEALCLGTPLVASAVGGLRDLANYDCAHLVDSPDPSELAHAITWALQGGLTRPATARLSSIRSVFDVTASARLLESKYLAALQPVSANNH